MYKLLVRLGENEYLWILALLLIRQFDNFKHKKFAPQVRLASFLHANHKLHILILCRPLRTKWKG